VIGLGTFIERPEYATERGSVSPQKSIPAMRLAASRSHRSPRMNRVVSELGFKEEVRRGSVGIKVGLIVEKQCDVYIHLSPRTKQWDTCAPQLILTEAGGELTDLFGEPLSYNVAEVQNRNGLVASLWRDVVTLWHYGVARGVDATHYGPTSPVTYAETVAFITRAMERKNYWVAQSAGPVPPGIPAVFNSEGRTFTLYAGSPPALPPGKGWNDGATRGWFAEALWAALDSYWGTDGNLPDGRPAGGNVP